MNSPGEGFRAIGDAANGAMLLRRLIDSVQDYAIFMLDPLGVVTTWNAGAQRIKGYAADEIIGRHFSLFYPEEAIASGWPATELAKAAEIGRFEDEGWRIRQDGSQFWANVIITAVRDSGGALLGFTKVTRDLTERRRRDEELRQSEENLRLLIEGVEDYAIFRLEPDGTVASWNRGAQRIKGYDAGEIVGQHFSRFYRSEDVERGWPAHELQQAAKAGRFEDEGWRVRKDGSLFWANVIITATYGPDGVLRGFSKITRDLTERRRNEQRLKESEERFRLLVEGVKDHAIFMLGTDGTVLGWNAGARRVHGFSQADIVGRSFAVLYTPEDIAANLPQAELALARADGFAEAVGWRMRQDGSRFRANVMITQLHGPDGAACGFAQVTHDLTDRERLEALETEGQRIDQSMAVLAHELRNPLAPIRSAVDVLERGATASELQWGTQLIARQVAHLSHLIEDLFDISRAASGKIRFRRDVLRLDELVAAAVESMRPTVAGFDHVLELVPAPEPLHVNGDATRLTQIVVNLVTNAAKYTPNGGRIRVVLERDGSTARLHVIDNGVGMSQALLDTAFELFVQGEHTLDRAGGGLGIGLALVKRLVLLHGGDIVAESAGSGAGTHMTVSLPLSRQPAQPAEARRPEGAAQPSRNVLVVDDNVDAATSLAAVLQALGHRTAVAHDGLEALRLAAADPPDAVLLDLGLPGVSGLEVAKRMRALPALTRARLIAVTGHASDDDRRASREAGFDVHLVKPVEFDDVLAALERIGQR